MIWTLERGAYALPDGGVRFSLWAPHASRVDVRILNGPAAGDHELAPSRREPGVFECTVAHTGRTVDYAFILDGDDTQLLPDPVSRWQPRGVHGPSRVIDPHDFQWTDQAWRGIEMRDLAVYEIHVGAFTSGGTFAEATQSFSELASLGVTAIEIMPVAQFPGKRNWGYDGVNLYAVHHDYGGPTGLRQLVDAAHRAGLAVILDVVYNHVGPEGNYLGRFGPYFTEKYRTPWGAALNYDDAHSDEVRRFIVDNARYWVSEYHIDGLRLDAVHGIFDFSAYHLLQELTEAVHEIGAQQNRSVVVIGESDLNDPKLVRPAEEYGFGLDGQWSDDFHHAVHAALTGERSGYYCDFGSTAQIARALEEPFVYAGHYSSHRKRRHGAPSKGIPRRRFIVALQNHDQVGNRAQGERLAALLDPPRLRLATALLLLSPYVPLIFMGEEYGETNPFLYFVSHGDAAVIDSVREGRRREFESFGWADDVPDPQAEETFRRSRIDRQRSAQPEHMAILQLYRDLLAIRRDEPLMRPDEAELTIAHSEGSSGEGWITLLREPAAPAFFPGDVGAHGEALLAVFNCSGSAVRVSPPASATGHWRLRLDTDAAAYGGVGSRTTVELPDDREGDVVAARGGEPRRLLPASAPPRVERLIELPPWSAALYERVGQPSAFGG